MYPRNSAAPERIAIGPVVQISDGAVQTSGVSVKVLPQGGTASASGGTVAYEEGVVHYLPTQAETNYASFVLIAYKSGCIPATTTVVTSASATTGYAGLDWAKVSAPTTTVGLSGTTISTAQKVDVETIKTQAVTAAAGVTFPTSVASPTNITAGTITSVTDVVSANVTQWLGTAAATPTVAGVPEVDVTHVSGSVTVSTFDSLSSQISAVGSGTGAALNFAVDADNASAPIKSVTAVGTQTGTFANTLADDGTLHQIASVGNAIDWVYGFSCGTARSASKFVSRASMDTTGDTVIVQAYNFVTPGWDTRTTITGTAETLRDIPLLSGHTGVSGADAGKVYIRFVYSEGDAGLLRIDEAYVQAQTSGSLVGYSDGAIWINTAASNTNTVPYIDGVADNPVSTIAAALTLAVALNLKRLRIANGSSITLGAAVEAYSLIGQNWSLALGGQSISGSYIEGASITGTATGANPPEFFNCHFVGTASAPTLPPSTLLRCGINTTTSYPLTAGSAGQFLLVDCFSEVAGSGTPYFTFSGANGVNIRRWSGGTNITLNNTSTVLSIEVVTGGGQTVAVGGADVEIRGICRAVTLTGVTTDSTVQIDAVTGPISIAGADGTVNIYGVCGVVTDSRTGTPLGTNSAISRVNINAEVDTAVLDGVNITRVNSLLIDGSGTELDPWGPAA